jgi:RimJ/RimL family protein N-acetyltransferase
MKAAIDMAKEMGFQTIEAEIYKSNPLSLRLADKFGMYPKEDKGNYYIVLRDLTTEPVSPSK